MDGTDSEGEKAREVKERLITQDVRHGGPLGPYGLGLQAALGAVSCSKSKATKAVSNGGEKGAEGGLFGVL